ncbi:hypothetical protein KCP74_23725 [Salmonella enterica subsp. enterica]|nr:hypothetical protein KCP74_23725 [Salmonella enterica subsp. enterica]
MSPDSAATFCRRSASDLAKPNSSHHGKNISKNTPASVCLIFQPYDGIGKVILSANHDRQFSVGVPSAPAIFTMRLVA